jgi:hypothetical protein
MNKIYVLTKDESGEGFYRPIYLLITESRRAWPAIGAICGLLGGMLAIILGALLWAIVPLLLQGHFRLFLNTLETVFFILPLPLLALGAYCLDLLEKTPPLLALQAKARPAAFENRQRLRP